jgi:hypothetical protein
VFHTTYSRNNLGQKCEGNCGLPIQPNLSGNGLDWLCYLAGNSQAAPTFFFQIFRILFFDYFIKNPQTTIALTFLTDIISSIGSVVHIILSRIFELKPTSNWEKNRASKWQQKSIG